MFAYQFGWYGFTRLPFGVASSSDMFQQNVNEIFKDLPDVFGNGDDSVIVGYDADSKDHDRTLRQEIQICHQ